MSLNLVFEFSMMVDTETLQNILSMVYSKSEQLREVENGYLDLSMAPKGIIVIFRDSQYKKKIRLLVNSCLVVDDPDNTDKLTRRLDKRISGYFNHQYQMDDFTLSAVNLVSDIDVGSRKNVLAYTKVLRRIGKVKGFSPTCYDGIDDKTSLCLSGNSNAIDFLLYDLESTLMVQLHSADVGRNKIQSTSEKVKGVLRTEVRLTKPKAIRTCTKADSTSSQIAELSKNRQRIFMNTFAQVIPYGDFYKKDNAIETIREKVKDSNMQRRMLRLLALIPEKKSLHLAQKAANCRDIATVNGSLCKDQSVSCDHKQTARRKALKKSLFVFLESLILVLTIFAFLCIVKVSFLQEGDAQMAGKNTEERIAAIDEKIAKKQAEIEALEAQKQRLLHPVNMRTVMSKAKEAGLTPEEIAEKLGLEV